jgi:hypothetical protein
MKVERRERGVANVDRLTCIQSQGAEGVRHAVDVGELRKRQEGLQPQLRAGTIREDLKDCVGY